MTDLEALEWVYQCQRERDAMERRQLVAEAEFQATQTMLNVFWMVYSAEVAALIYSGLNPNCWLPKQKGPR